MIESSNIFALTIALIMGFVLGFLYRWILNIKNKKKNLQYQGSILKGKISEQLAAYLPDWPKDLNPSEAKFLGDPVDFVVLKGLDQKNISEVVFVELKSGRKYPNNNEDGLKKAVEQKRVRYVPFHIPIEVFKN